MPIHKLDQKLVELSALKNKFNLEREIYLGLTGNLVDAIQSLDVTNMSVNDVHAIIYRTETQGKINNKGVWSKEANAWHLTELDAAELKHLENLIKVNDNLVDWVSFNKLEAKMENNPKWIRFKEIKEKSASIIKDENEAKEFLELMKDANVERMINAINFRDGGMGAYSGSFQAGVSEINKFSEMTADIQYRLMERAEVRAEILQEYQQQHKAVEVETQEYLKTLGLPDENEIFVKDLVNFVESINENMLIQNNENGLSLADSITKAANSVELFEEFPVARVAKAYCLEKCITLTQAITNDILMDAENTRLLSFAKVNPKNMRTLSTATDFSEVLGKASKHLYFVENKAEIEQQQEFYDVDMEHDKKAIQTMEERLELLGLSKEETRKIKEEFIEGYFYEDDVDSIYGDTEQAQRENYLAMNEYYDLSFPDFSDFYTTERDAVVDEWDLEISRENSKIEGMEFKFI
ncbi:MAG: hypothetical protein PSN36_01920 [Gammaproteobacteria bacterium]|nr:hypothetical protein [Gammaproteobacteria bacterium]